MKNNSVSLVIPCYNETDNIKKGALDTIGSFTKNDDRFREVLIVDDGSTDDSKKQIKKTYLQKFPKFRLIENNHAGKAFAVITGIREAHGDYVFGLGHLVIKTDHVRSHLLSDRSGHNHKIRLSR